MCEQSDRVSYDVLCMGIMVADVLALPVRGLPPRGALGLIEHLELQPGGCAVNTGIGLARLGLQVGLIGKVGQDGFGDFLLHSLRREGIGIEGVSRDPVAHTSATVVMVDEGGERTFLHYIGANATIREAPGTSDLMRRSRILHVAGSNVMPGFDGEPTASTLREAHSLSLTTSLDTAWDPSGRWLSLIAPVLPHVDVFVPSLNEARQIAGYEEPADVAAFFLDYGIGTVALKMGDLGCYVRTAQEGFEVPAYPVQVVDTTGAGDAFAAGFLTGLVLGWDLLFTARFANAVGALCVTAVGATAGLRSLQETLAFVHEHENANPVS